MSAPALPPDGVPPRPPSETEWEELLVRVELVPRAVRTVLDDAAPGTAAAVAGELRALLGRETWLADALEALRTGAPLPEPRADDTARAGEDGDPRALAERFARLRGRNFAAVQRRGIDVWGWESPAAGGGVATAYRVLTGVAAADGGSLGRLRRAAGGAR